MINIQESYADPITQLPNFQYSGTMLPESKDIFNFRYGKNTYFKKLSGEVLNGEKLYVNKTPSEAQAMIYHIGYYQGKNINVKITLTGRAGGLYINKKDFLNIDLDIGGWITIKFEFFDQANNLVSIPLTTNWNKINKQVSLKIGKDKIRYLIADPTNQFTYKEESNGELTLQNNVTSAVDTGINSSLQCILYPTTEVSFNFNHKQGYNSYIKYNYENLNASMLSNAYGLDERFDTFNSNDLTLTAVQDISNNIADESNASNGKLNALATNFRKEIDSLPFSQYKIDGFQVLDSDGNNLTDLFSLSVKDENDIILIARNPKDNRLYNTALMYLVKSKWIGSEEKPVDPGRIDNNGYLKVPFEVQTTSIPNNTFISKGQSSIFYKGNININFVDIDNPEKILRDPLTIPSILTLSFDLSKEYPDIPNYQPVFTPSNDSENNDKGILLEKTKEITHQYLRKNNIHFEILNKDSLTINQGTQTEVTMNFSVSLELSDAYDLYGEYNGKRQLIHHYTTSNGKKDSLTFNIPKEWIGKKVIFYVVSNHYNTESNKEERQIIAREPELRVPPIFSFGETEIKNEKYGILLPDALKNEIKVIDDAQVKWKINIKEMLPFSAKNEEQLLERIHFTIKGKEYILNQEDQTILTGETSTQLDKNDSIFIIITPADKPGKYQGILEWTLLNGPS